MSGSTAPTSLKGLEFSDLFLPVSQGKKKVKGLNGTDQLQDLPAPYHEEAETLLKKCLQHHADNPDNRRDFAVIHDDIQYRVSVISDIRGEVFVLGKGMDRIPSLKNLGLPSYIRDKLCDPELESGLIVISGPMRGGKTTTASAFVQERLRRYDEYAITIEDPPELPISGEVEGGEGVCFQTEVSQSFRKEIVRAMRYGSPDIIFLGELRNAEAVSQALKAGINGHLIVTTVHANGVQETFKRLVALEEEAEDEASLDLMADALRGIIYQHLEEQPRTLVARGFFIDEENEQSVRSKIRNGRIGQLSTDIERQKKRMLHYSAKGNGQNP